MTLTDKDKKIIRLFSEKKSGESKKLRRIIPKVKIAAKKKYIMVSKDVYEKVARAYSFGNQYDSYSPKSLRMALNHLDEAVYNLSLVTGSLDDMDDILRVLKRATEMASKTARRNGYL